MPDPIEGKAADSPAQPASPAAPAPSPAAAAKPAAKAAPKSYEPPDKGRRRLIWALIFSYLGINLLLFLRFFFPRALYEPNTVFSVGYPSDFALGVNQQFLASNRIWIVREPGRVFTIFARCTHLGCTPEWKPSENKSNGPRENDLGRHRQNHRGYQQAFHGRSARWRESIQRSGSVP
jgi:hypothetical protein